MAERKDSSAELIPMFLAQPAQLSRAQSAAIEERATSFGEGVNRRVMLATLTKSGGDLVNAAAKDPNTMAELLLTLEAFKQRAQALAEMANSAHIRVGLALATSCENLTEVMEKARAASEAGGAP